MSLRTIVKEEKLGPEEQKLKESFFELPLIIKYGNEVYQIKYSELNNLGLSQCYEEIVDKLKMENLNKNFGKHCISCPYNTKRKFSEGEISESFVLRLDTDRDQADCTYEGKAEVAIMTKGSFYAIDTKCAFYDALIGSLVENGWLMDYETEKEFDFLPLSEFSETNKKDYEKISTLDKLKILFNYIGL